MQVEMVMFKADGQRRSFTLRKDVTVVGRATECDFQIPLPAVSRRHCQLTLEGGVVQLRDLGSSNGTFVNEKRVQEAELQAGDRLTIGPVIFTVVIDGQPAEISPTLTTAGGAGVLELDHGTVDVDAERPAVSDVKEAADAPAEEVTEVVEEITEVDEVVEIAEPVAEVEEPATDDPLAALESMTRPKNRK